MKKISLLIVLSIIASLKSIAQISGPTVVCPSSVVNYQVTVGDGIGAGIYKWYMNGVWNKTFGNSFSANILIPAAGTAHTISVEYIPTAGATETYYLYASSFAVGTASSGYSIVCAGTNATVQLYGYVGSDLVWQRKDGNGAWYNVDQGFGFNPNLNAVNLTQTTYFQAVLNTGACGQLISNMITINVYSNLDPGTIGGQQTICYNTTAAILNNASFPTGSTGAYTYQWQYYNGSTWVNIGGATSDSYSPGLLTTTTQYRRLVNTACQSLSSNFITVTVYPPVGGGSINTAHPICPSSAAPAFSSSAATGGNYTYAYQWQYSSDNSSWYTAPGASNNATYSPPVQTSNHYYRRRVVSCGQEAYSNSFLIAVYSPLVAGSISNYSTNICSGSAALTFVSSSDASGSNGGYLYQWEQSVDNTNWYDASGIAYTPTYAPPTQTLTTHYRRKVSACNETVYSNTVTIAVFANVVGGTIANATLSVCPATAPTAFTITVGASLGDGNYTYQWEQSANNVNWITASGSSTSATYAPSALNNATYFRRRVSSCGQLAYSNTVTIQVFSALQAGSIASTSTTICSGTVPASISSVADATGSNGAYTYQWQQSTDGNNWINASGNSASSTYSPPALASAMHYRRRVSACGQTAYSNTAIITIYAPLTAGSIDVSSKLVCSGVTPPSFTNQLSPTGGNGYSYVWEQSTDGINFTPATGDNTGITYTPPALNSPIHYRRQVNSCGTSAFSNIEFINVSPNTVAGIVIGGVEAYGVASGNLALTEFTGVVQKWQQKVGNGDWADINSTATIIAYSNVNTSRQYRAVVKSGGCPELSTSATDILIYDVPSITIQGNSSIPAGGSTSIVSSPNLHSYQWYRNNQLLPGEISSTLTVTKPGLYKVAAKASGTSPIYTTGEAEIRTNNTMPLLDMNYVMTFSFNKEGINEQSDLYDLNTADYTQNTNYFDGLGRPVQSVALGAAADSSDLITPIEYDAFGREAKKYLPYAHADRDGRYQPTALTEQSIFYGNAGDRIADDITPYALTIFEPSPLNRVIKQGSPGEAWQPDGVNAYNSTDHTVKFSYEFNLANEVLQWTFTYPTEEYTSTALNAFGKVEAGTTVAPVFYAANQLYKNKTKDEQGNQVIEYVDKDGRTVLKRVQVVTGNPSTTDVNRDTNWASTYYIYDDFGNLVCVIPPEPSKRMVTQYCQAGNTEVSKNNFLKRWAFRYRYDGRQRMIMKQVPGAEPVYMVYDDRDRLVMTQDGNQRTQNQWSFTKYDALNRPVVTGLYTHTSLQTQQQMSGNISTTAFAEVLDTNQPHGYITAIFPNTNLTVHSVTFYDNYNFTLPDAGLNFVATHLTGQEPVADTTRVRGQVTATKVNILNSADYLWTVNYYDDKYRPIQIVSQNHVGGIMRTTNKYDFVKLVQTKTTTTTSTATHSTQRNLVYDAAGRLTETWHKINEQDAILLVKNEYNELGQLADKKLHSEDNGTSFAQSVDYAYNIRGWLTAINDAALTLQANEAKDHFGFELSYNTVDASLGNSALFNGNISATRWSENMGYSTIKQRGYVYEYDALNRLENAHSKEKAGSWITPVHNAFKEGGLQYDLNGNIEQLQRHDASATMLDNLTYTYEGNQLKKVEDIGNSNAGFKDGSNITTEYTYDANGNMTSDANKKIASISYNNLNLPYEIVNESGDRIVYYYTAGGQKLKQEVDTVGTITPEKTTDYVGELIIENDTIKMIQHEEGRIIPSPLSSGEGQGGEATYQYHLKDHLGNVRVTFTTKEDIEENTATLETTNENEERANFLKYDDIRKVNSRLFDHTNTGSTQYAIRLSGTPAETYGLARSIAVMPGDVVSAEVFAKYLDKNQNNWGEDVTVLIEAIAGVPSSPGQVIDGGSYGSPAAGTIPFLGPAGKSNEPSDVPRAYLNWIVCDKNFFPIASKSGFKRITDDAYEDGKLELSEGVYDPEGREHEALESPLIEITEPGYVYIYLSNEEPGTEVYFDDFKVTHAKSPVIQSDDYYPFGLAFNSYIRENSTKNNYLYNGKELQDELDLGWYDYQARQYDPTIGRFTSIDPAADLMRRFSPYAYAFDNPVRFTDPDGMIPFDGVDQNSDLSFEDSKGKAPIELDPGFCKSCEDQKKPSVKADSEFKFLAGDPKGSKRSKRKDVKLASDEAPHPLKEPVYALGWLFTKVAESAINLFGQMSEKDIGFGPQAVENSTIKIFVTATDGNVVQYMAKVGDETIEFIANVTKEGEKLILKNLHIEGSGAGSMGVKNLYEVARQLGKQEGVQNVIVEGGKRTTGKYKGTTPTPIEIKVN